MGREYERTIHRLKNQNGHKYSYMKRCSLSLVLSCRLKCHVFSHLSYAKIKSLDSNNSDTEEKQQEL